MHICDDLVAFRLSEMLKLQISIFMLDDVFKWVEIENQILEVLAKYVLRSWCLRRVAR